MLNEKILLNQGKILINCQMMSKIEKLEDSEFSIFSQFQDDGIIQFLIRQLRSIKHVFVEFGVENYLESNTRFLLQNNNWTGLIMDGNKKNIEMIKTHHFYWKHDLTAVHSFVTAENINNLLESHLSTPEVGLLHIDIDGNDYWIWKAIESIDPQIVIVEYNSVFGSERAITIPYFQDFQRTKYHYTNLYAGSSLLALCDLADLKGYYFVGSNSAGNNAYFVKKEFIGDLKVLSAAEGYVSSKFRESRDERGNLSYLRSNERLTAIRGLPVFNTRTNQMEQL